MCIVFFNAHIFAKTKTKNIGKEHNAHPLFRMVIKINGASRVQRAGLLEMPSGIDFKSNKSHKAL
jgi:hypothetical protein